MKRLSLVLLAFAALSLIANQTAHSSPAAGAEILENADLADGTLRWRGDCKAAGSDSATDFVTKPEAAKGIMVDLRASTWTTVRQEIRSLHTTATSNSMQLSIEYQISPDFSLSVRGSDYTGDDTKTGIGGLLGFGLSHIFGRPGQILALLDTAPANRGGGTGNGMMLIYLDKVSMQSFTPGAGAPHTFTVTMTMPPNGQDNPVFCVAIPPGHGSITFSKISLQKMTP